MPSISMEAARAAADKEVTLSGWDSHYMADRRLSVLAHDSEGRWAQAAGVRVTGPNGGFYLDMAGVSDDQLEQFALGVLDLLRRRRAED